MKSIPIDESIAMANNFDMLSKKDKEEEQLTKKKKK